MWYICWQFVVNCCVFFYIVFGGQQVDGFVIVEQVCWFGCGNGIVVDGNFFQVGYDGCGCFEWYVIDGDVMFFDYVFDFLL